MKRFVISTITAATLAAATLGLAGVAAAAAPSGPGGSSDVVHQLEAKGYEVIVTTTGHGSQSCSITSVRPGHTFVGKSKEIHGVQTPVQAHKTMYVDQRC